jgi:hypothetical protein
VPGFLVPVMACRERKSIPLRLTGGFLCLKVFDETPNGCVGVFGKFA